MVNMEIVMKSRRHLHFAAVSAANREMYRLANGRMSAHSNGNTHKIELMILRSSSRNMYHLYAHRFILPHSANGKLASETAKYSHKIIAKTNRRWIRVTTRDDHFRLDE